jgi:hypothetical protein
MLFYGRYSIMACYGSIYRAFVDFVVVLKHPMLLTILITWLSTYIETNIFIIFTSSDYKDPIFGC